MCIVNSDVENVKCYVANVNMYVTVVIRIESLREMIASWLEVDCNNCDIKYIIMYDENVLIDLDDEEEVVNLFAHNERIGHIYIEPQVLGTGYIF